MAKQSPTNSQTAALGHPISVVAERTGLSPDVLRVWERRYGAVQPTRSAGGQRLYSNEQIDRFRLLAAATRYGRYISMVAALPSEAIARLVADDEAERVTPPPVSVDAEHAERVEAALGYALALDGTSLDRELRRTVARLGAATFLEAVVPMFMRRVGEEWHAGRLSIAHEHLASAAVLAIVFETMRAVPETPGAPRLLVTTPAGERHAVGAALAAAAAALDGWTVIYLGVDVPAADIVTAATASGARAVALSVVYSSTPDIIVRELRAVRASLSANVSVIVGGAATADLARQLTQPGMFLCASLAELRGVLARDAGLARLNA